MHLYNVDLIAIRGIVPNVHASQRISVLEILRVPPTSDSSLWVYNIEVFYRRQFLFFSGRKDHRVYCVLIVIGIEEKKKFTVQCAV